VGKQATKRLLDKLTKDYNFEIDDVDTFVQTHRQVLYDYRVIESFGGLFDSKLCSDGSLPATKYLDEIFSNTKSVIMEKINKWPTAITVNQSQVFEARVDPPEIKFVDVGGYDGYDYHIELKMHRYETDHEVLTRVCDQEKEKVDSVKRSLKRKSDKENKIKRLRKELAKLEKETL